MLLCLHSIPPFMSRHAPHIWYLTILSLVAFFPLLGGVHLFDWDEINFAECAREMIESDNYLQMQINFQPFWEKPPLFTWLQVVSMKIFGVNEYAARFPNALCGLITLLSIYKVGAQQRNKEFGFLWALCYAGAILPHLYFKSGIIDPWFNLFIFLGLASFFHRNNILTTLIGGAFIGLAVLTKGPAAIIISGLTLCISQIFHRKPFFRFLLDLILFYFASVLVAGTWFGLEYAQNGGWFIQQFVEYQIRLFSTHDAGHAGFFGYHFVILLLGCFPSSIFAIKGLFSWGKSISPLGLTLKVMFWVVLILFSIIQTKIAHYSSLCYFPIAFFAADALSGTQKPGFKALFGFIGILFGLVVAIVPFLGNRLDMIRPLLSKDPFALANLEADVEWPYWQAVVGVAYVALIIWLLLRYRNIHERLNYYLLFGGTMVFLQLVLILFVNKIESITQRAAIEFYQSVSEEDALIQPVWFKSYAHLFYGKAKNKHPQQQTWEFLLTGPIETDVYFVAKIHRLKDLDKTPGVKELYRKNGFVFFKRSKAAGN